MLKKKHLDIFWKFLLKQKNIVGSMCYVSYFESALNNVITKQKIYENKHY